MEFSLLLINVALLSIFSGLILNFMPCVLPLVGVKIASFSRVKSPLDVKILASFTVVGILTFCTLLSLIFIFFNNLYLGFQLQIPSFVSFLILIFCIFILVLNGRINISVPVSVGRFKSSALEGFFSGFLIVVFSLSCLAPVLTSALSLTFTSKSPFLIFICLFCIGVGLSTPYLLAGFCGIKLAFNGKSVLSKIAKMLSFFAIALTILYLLFVLKSQIKFYLVLGVVAWCIFVIFLLYKFKSLYIFLLGVLIVCLIPLANFKKKEAQSDYIPFSKERLNTYLDRGFRVMVSIEASWCVTCQANNVMIINTEEFKAFLLQENIIQMKGDLTIKNKEIEEFMQNFNAHGVPFYAIFSPDYSGGRSLPIFFTIEALKNNIQNLSK